MTVTEKLTFSEYVKIITDALQQMQSNLNFDSRRDRVYPIIENLWKRLNPDQKDILWHDNMVLSISKFGGSNWYVYIADKELGMVISKSWFSYPQKAGAIQMANEWSNKYSIPVDISGKDD